MTIVGIAVAAILAAPSGEAVPESGSSNTRSGSGTSQQGLLQPPFDAARAAAASESTEEPAPAPTAEELEAERRKVARQPKDLRNPFLLASWSTRHASNRYEERDLRHPFRAEGATTRGSGAEPQDLRNPFDRAHAMPPVELSPRQDRCDDKGVPGGIIIQRPRALQQELCGSASTHPAVRQDSPALVAVAQPAVADPSNLAS